MIERVKIGFWYEFQLYGIDGKLKSASRFENLLPDESRDLCMAAWLQAGVQYSTFYIGIYANDRTPLYADKATDLGEYGEISEVSEVERPAWSPSALVGGVLESSANPSVFTATSEFTARGAFLVTTQPFETNSGILISVAEAPSPKVVEVGEVLRVPAGISLLT